MKDIERDIKAGLDALRDELDTLRAMQVESRRDRIAAIETYNVGGWNPTATGTACPGCKQRKEPLTPGGEIHGCGCPSVRWRQSPDGDWDILYVDETDPS